MKGSGLEPDRRPRAVHRIPDRGDGVVITIGQSLRDVGDYALDTDSPGAYIGGMASLMDVAREFETEETCLAYLEAMHWPGGVACLKCGSVKVSKTVSTVKNRRTGKVSKTRYLYDCLEPKCGHQFSATTGTIFHDSHLPLSKWFMAVALFCNAKKSLSALQLQRDLGIGSYRTAWYLAHRIRKAMEDQSSRPFVGMVEMDETFIGGKYDKRRKRARFEKQQVIGFVERNSGGGPSQVRAFPIRKSNGRIVLSATRANVSKDAHLYTDHALIYRALDLDKNFSRWQVNHIAGEYVRDYIHTTAWRTSGACSSAGSWAPTTASR